MHRLGLVIITHGNSGYEFTFLISTFMEHKPKNHNAFAALTNTQ